VGRARNLKKRGGSKNRAGAPKSNSAKPEGSSEVNARLKEGARRDKLGWNRKVSLKISLKLFFNEGMDGQKKEEGNKIAAFQLKNRVFEPGKEEDILRSVGLTREDIGSFEWKKKTNRKHYGP